VSWKKAEAGDLPALLALARRQEWRAVHFSSRLRSARLGGRAGLPSRLEAALLLHRAGAEATAALLLTSGGLLLPLLPAPGGQDCEAPRFPRWRGLARSLHSVMGPLREVRWAEQNLPFPPRVAVDYHLMGLERRDYRPPREQPPLPGLRLRAARPQDARGLYPLQRDYELEEVLIEPGHFNAQACLANLRRTLRCQIVILAELDGLPVSKAGTNARGFDADQIGGVFTLEEERGRGIARRVMGILLERIFREKAAASLFVKKQNQAAVALYRRLGFRELEDFRISYFGD
jgi:GNAT superfamily N-acetyltransferase